MKKILCARCAAEYDRSRYKVQKVAGGVNEKVTCQKCGRRHYGGEFTVTRKIGKEK